MGVNGKPIRESLTNIDPYDFEHLVAKIWDKNGWDTEVMPGSQDRGIDVIASQEDPISLTIAIQAKAYNESNKIGSKDVREYRTLYEQEEGLNAVVIITTGWFTSQAEELADDLEISLLDLDDVVNLVASIDLLTYHSVVSPIESSEYDITDIPYPSSKGGCPECSTSGTLWEADLEGNNQIMACEKCDAKWKKKTGGSWVSVN